jgi:hypothetical protein
VVKHWPTETGDVLILRTSVSYTAYAVGPVATAGQTDFGHGPQPHYVTTYAEAVKVSKAMVAPRGRIYLLDIDTGELSEISN